MSANDHLPMYIAMVSRWNFKNRGLCTDDILVDFPHNWHGQMTHITVTYLRIIRGNGRA
jgi:hypothetical protein